jgi:hypothetical protein
MKFIVVSYHEVDEKVNPEKFGDWLREKRAKYIKLLETEKLSILVV